MTIPYNSINAQIILGVVEDARDTPEEAAYRRRAAAEYVRLTAEGKTFDLKIDISEPSWGDRVRDDKKGPPQ